MKQEGKIVLTEKATCKEEVLAGGGIRRRLNSPPHEHTEIYNSIEQFLLRDNRRLIQQFLHNKQKRETD